MCFVLYQMFVEEYLVCCGIHVFTITINSYSLFSHFLLHTCNNYSLLKSSYACEIQLSKKSQTSFYWQQCRYGSKFISIKFYIECQTSDFKDIPSDLMICYIQSYVFLKFAILGIPNITILIFTCQQSQTGLINGCELENATLFYHYEILFAIYFYFANGFPVFPLTLS